MDSGRRGGNQRGRSGGRWHTTAWMDYFDKALGDARRVRVTPDIAPERYAGDAGTQRIANLAQQTRIV